MKIDTRCLVRCYEAEKGKKKNHIKNYYIRLILVVKNT